MQLTGERRKASISRCIYSSSHVVEEAEAWDSRHFQKAGKKGAWGGCGFRTGSCGYLKLARPAKGIRHRPIGKNIPGRGLVRTLAHCGRREKRALRKKAYNGRVHGTKSGSLFMPFLVAPCTGRGESSVVRLPFPGRLHFGSRQSTNPPQGEKGDLEKGLPVS